MALRPAPPGVAALREHFQHASLLPYFPPLPSQPSREEYLDAFAIRDQIAQLFLGEQPFFERPTPLDQGRREVEELCRLVIKEGVDQRALMATKSDSRLDRLSSLRKSIDSSERDSERWELMKRPFCRLFLDNYAAPMLFGFVQKSAYYMAEARHHNPQSHVSPEIWLGFEHWQSLDPYTKARVVRRAKAYYAMEKTASELAARRRLSAAASSATAGQLFSNTCAKRTMQDYVRRVALRMAKACLSNPRNASPIVWIGFERWQELDPYTKARVVLIAKKYSEAIESVYQQRVLSGTISPPRPRSAEEAPAAGKR
ncbi:hypothetical protein BCR35DRAFT_335362 [Leucosporidium creatinivorum]|uniref:Uncharacterized protein n=1 Tax=Leucosporidium creatinivorum TaxID=106004 RepID=A0A1Y2DCX0_9BASI|nr:hypothetical protein BCR35DRAFT_335362 [Leucosporidium creatinivorum]